MSRNSTPLARSASTRGEDVVGRDGEVLGAGAVVELEVLVDLRLLLGDRRLVERELHAVVAVGDDLRHQRGVVGGDVVTDELGHVREAHHLVVEVDPLVHPAELDVADDVVEGLEQALGLAVLRRQRGSTGDVAGEVGTGVAAVDGATRVCRVSPYVAMAAIADRAVLVGDVLRLDAGPSRRPSGPARCTGRRRGPRGRCRRRRRRGGGGGRCSVAVGRDGAAHDELDGAGLAARTTCGRGCRSRGRSRRSSSIPHAELRSSARSGWRCRPRSTIASHPVTGNGSASASYSTRPTSWRSCSSVRSAFSSSTVRAPPVEAMSVVMGRTMPSCGNVCNSTSKRRTSCTVEEALHGRRSTAG